MAVKNTPSSDSIVCIISEDRVIFSSDDAYIENNDFILTDKQRQGAYEEYNVK